MKNDRKLIISTGSSRHSVNWPRVEMMWSEFIEKLRVPQRTTETIEQYLGYSKAGKDKLKDIGGFVGGTLSGPRRKADAVTGRDLITLDLDNIATGETQDVLRKIDGLGAGYAVYSTRSHAEWRPRLRVILPLDRTVTADEYEPIARQIGSLIGIVLCDPTTFEASRLMYWPSCSADSQYVFTFGDKPFVSADGILARYQDWRDVRTWPVVPGTEKKEKSLLAKQADPTKKQGVVGAFCRMYNIYEAIAEFIPNAYVATDKDDRLTYAGGSTIAGAIVYDNGSFLYSHHATDPCSGELVNAFDMVRRHLYGDRDAEAKQGTPINKLPSYKAMKHLAMGDHKVAEELNVTMAAKASDVFRAVAEEPSTDAGQPEVADAQPAPAVPNVSWMKTARLEYDENTGKPKKTRDNIIRILNYDPELADKIVTDEFAVRGMAVGSLPWDSRNEKRLWTDTDDEGLAWYLESRYDITGRDKIEGATMLVAARHTINEVKDYLAGLKWDKVKRIDTVLHDYLGAEQSEYTAAVARKSLTAAVARVFEPGIKYDYVPVFVGPQGIGKTTFLATLGKNWYSDSLQNFDGKTAMEMIQGIWINELGEMNSYNKSETGIIKQFLSKREDIYRQAYGHRTARYPRKGVFFGTCNQFDFLKDLTGNRRFWPVDLGVEKTRKSVWDDLPKEVDQIWAEAVMYYRIGEPLYFTGGMEDAARDAQDKHREVNAKEGIIQDFLDRPVPKNYESMTLSSRRMYWQGGMHNEVDMVPREKTCALEIWCEALNGDIKFMKRADAVEINHIIENLSGWVRNKNVRRYGYCGIQKGFERL